MVTLVGIVGLHLGESALRDPVVTASTYTRSPEAGVPKAAASHAPGMHLSRGQAIRRELETSSDVFATFEKYVAEPDPTGEVAFYLSRAISECSDFMYTLDQFNERMPFLSQAVLESKARAQVIERRIKQCAGYATLGPDHGQGLYKSLLEKAAAARYPGALAEMLWLRLIGRQPSEQLDAEAIQVLSHDPDDAVIKGVFLYLGGRNGQDWWAQFGDPAIATAAWMLLPCNYGAACDDSSRLVIMACVYHAACDQHHVEDALPFWHPSLTQDSMNQVMRAQAYFASLIRNREWGPLFPARGPATAKY